MKTIYVDNNATTRVAPEVLEEMLPYFSELYGNPSSMHRFGGEVGRKLREAREKIAALIGAHPDEIILTSCGTESDNTAISAAIRSNPEKRHIVTTRVEHPAIKNLYEYLAKNGYRTTFVPVDNKGHLDMDFLYKNLTKDTAIVSIMWANNESGVLFPIEELAGAVKERGIVFHTDAVQAAGKVPVDVRKAPVDMLSMSGHKIHGPQRDRRAVCSKGYEIFPLSDRRPSGTWPPRRDGKHGFHYRTGEGLRTGAKKSQR